MQPDRFTIKSQEAVAEAQRVGSERGNPEVGPAHLLLALLRQREGLVVPVLRKAGRNVGEIEERTLEAIDALPKLSGDAAPDVRPSSEFVRAIQAAEKEMAGLGDEYISTEHILLAPAAKGSGGAQL